MDWDTDYDEDSIFEDADNRTPQVGKHDATEALALQKAGRVREVVELDPAERERKQEARELASETAMEVVAGFGLVEQEQEPGLTLDSAEAVVDAAVRAAVASRAQNPRPESDPEAERQKKMRADFAQAFQAEITGESPEPDVADYAMPSVTAAEAAAMDAYLNEPGDDEQFHYEGDEDDRY